MIKWFGENIVNEYLIETIEIISFPDNLYYQNYIINEIRNRLKLYEERYENLNFHNKFSLICISHEPIFIWEFKIKIK